MKTTKIRQQILDNFSVAPELQKAVSDELEKAVYVDNAKNRKLGRVGRAYGHKGTKDPEMQATLNFRDEQNARIEKQESIARRKKEKFPNAIKQNIKQTISDWSTALIKQYGGTKKVPKRIQSDIKDMMHSTVAKNLQELVHEHYEHEGTWLETAEEPKITKLLLNGGKIESAGKVGKALSGLKSYKKLRNSINEIHSYLTDDMEDGWDD